jgi:mannose-6-phosphate isomerase-like protein (cupin superfamily)
MQPKNRQSAVEVMTANDFTTLANPGVSSLQLIWPGNSPSSLTTVTRVTVAPGRTQPLHSHQHSEQIWIVQSGRAELLLAGNETRSIGAGQVVRTPAGEFHGLRNAGTGPFVYLAITTPPVDFRAAYQAAR